MEINIPARLKELRKSRGWSQQQVAIKLRITRSAYQSYEENRAIPPLHLLIAISELYSLYSLDQLLLIKEGSKQKVNKVITAYNSIAPEQRKIVDYILNLNC